jgi:histidinol-phosphate aminotransferase
LRAQGCKLRDASSFGLHGWARVNTLTPHAQDALMRALR